MARMVTGLIAMLLLVLAADAAAAGGYTPVLGVFLINDNLDLLQAGVARSDNSGTGLGFGLALDGGGSQRISLEYTDFDLGDSRQLQLLDFNADQFFSPAGLPEPLRPFVGLALGYGRLDYPASAAEAGDRAEQLAYGVRLGATWQLAPRFALELGGRYLHTGLATHPAPGERFEVNADSSLWLGLEYRLQ